MRVRLDLVTVALILLLSVLSCSPASPTVLPTPSPPPAGQGASQELTATRAQPVGASPTPEPAPPTPTSVPPSPTPAGTQQPVATIPPEQPFGGAEMSPSYDIYVGLIQQGFCGPETNSGWFERLSFDALFADVRFVPSSDQLPLPNGALLGAEALVPWTTIRGEGEIDDFALCPDYDDGPRTCQVTRGPLPFEPILEVMQDPALARPVAPLVGDAPDPGEVVPLLFHVGSTADLGTILEWESAIGKGALGGSLQPLAYMLTVPWKVVMAGEPYSIEVPYEDEGERVVVTLRLFPRSP